jgi:predicted DCC family thiol-disulfide oxidoreductase YuxK
MNNQIYPLEFLYDGSCPICRADVAKLRKADKNSKLIFIDITEPDFNPQEYERSLESLLARIHARRADGLIVEGPEVFRLSLAAVGLGWLVAPTRWPVLNFATEITYSWFARNRTTFADRFDKFSRTSTKCDLRCAPQREKYQNTQTTQKD